VPPLGPVAAFRSALAGALSTYVEDLPAGDPHPFVRHRPDEVYFDIWGVVMGAAGHQIPHIHPSGWLSGVYYAELPDLGAAPAPRGWLELGPPDRQLPGDVRWPVRSFEPRVGQLVVFPSYLYHHTVPTGVDAGIRVSVAFDAIPMPAAPAR
jgi:hypothetical protein